MTLASKGPETEGQGRRELDGRVARPEEEGRDAVSLGNVYWRPKRMEEKKKERRVGAGPDGGAELVASQSSRHRDDGTWALARQTTSDPPRKGDREDASKKGGWMGKRMGFRKTGDGRIMAALPPLWPVGQPSGAAEVSNHVKAWFGDTYGSARSAEEMRREAAISGRHGANAIRK